MVIIKRKQCIYYVKEEQVVLEYNRQYTSFNVYQLQSRKKFKDYKLELLSSAKDQFDNINDAIGLATRYNLVGMLGHRPQLSENDTYLI